MREDLEVWPGVVIPRGEFTLTQTRSRGAGGQNVNKVNSRVELRWPVTQSKALPLGVHRRFLRKVAPRLTQEGDLIIAAQEHREATRNAATCYERLRAMIISVRYPPKPRVATKPTKGSQRRRLKKKKARGQTKKNRSWRPGGDG